MTEFFELTKDWFLDLGDQYGVNPIIFGSIYVGAIPFFTISIGWLVKNYQNGRSILLPAFSATFFFISAYLYLIIAGENVPGWVYTIVAILVGFGAWSTVKKIQSRIKSPEK